MSGFGLTQRQKYKLALEFSIFTSAVSRFCTRIRVYGELEYDIN